MATHQHLIPGSLYQISHRRKGTFVGRFISHNAAFYTFQIVKGETIAMCEYNIAYEGEKITMRGSFFTAKAIEQGGA